MPMFTMNRPTIDERRAASAGELLASAMQSSRDLGMRPSPALAEYRNHVERQARSLLIDALITSYKKRGPACEVLASLRAIDRAPEDAIEFIGDHWANIMQVGINEYDAAKESE